MLASSSRNTLKRATSTLTHDLGTWLHDSRPCAFQGCDQRWYATKAKERKPRNKLPTGRPRANAKPIPEPAPTPVPVTPPEPESLPIEAPDAASSSQLQTGFHRSRVYEPLGLTRSRVQLYRDTTRNPGLSYRGGGQRDPLTRYNMFLAEGLDSRPANIGLCMRICKEMTGAGVRPNLETYNHILRACGALSFGQEARAVVEDMLAVGIRPDETSFCHVIDANRSEFSNVIWEILDQMELCDVIPTGRTLSHVFSRHLAQEDLEMALQQLVRLNERGVQPDFMTGQTLVKLAANQGFPRLAIDLADAFENSSVRKMDMATWMTCLISSAEALYADGVEQCWNLVVSQVGILPDEGTVLAVLNTAARNGRPVLAADALAVLKQLGGTYREHHFAPVIEAFCRIRRIKDSLAVLHMMRENDIEPAPHTTHPIFKIISESVETLDATWGMLDDLAAEKQGPELSALNVVVQSAVALGDLQRAVGTYQTFGEYGVAPSVRTYNLLLAGCADAGHRALGDKLMKEMKAARTKPDAETYQELIRLCLTQDNYEDAFFYLEEMKAVPLLPTQAIYEGIITRCVGVADQRFRIALEEMKELGYPLTPELLKVLHQDGQPIEEEPTHVDEGAAQDFDERDVAYDEGEARNRFQGRDAGSVSDAFDRQLDRDHLEESPARTARP